MSLWDGQTFRLKLFGDREVDHGETFCAPDDTMVYPGHGDPTTIGYEKKYNPVVSYTRFR